MVSTVLYQIRNKKKIFIIHHDRIKLCEDRSLPNWVARVRAILYDDCEDTVIEGEDEYLADESPNLAKIVSN